MTQTLIEQLEALAAEYKDSYSSAYFMEEDLHAIIEQHKQEVGGKAVIKIHPEGWEYGEEPAGELYTGGAVAVLALKNTELSKRISVLEDLLSSAYDIANRNGVDTHWFRFAAQLHINGISPVTAKTFKILPSDPEYTTPQPDLIAELVKALEDVLNEIENGTNCYESLDSGDHGCYIGNSINPESDACVSAEAILAKVKGVVG